MFEHRTEPLLPRTLFRLRLARYAAIAGAVVLGGLGLGILGYHYLGHLGWIDAIVNAAMILGGMGPVNNLETNTAKLFAAWYALFSGILFLVVMGVVFAPLIHRLLHAFHLELDDGGPYDCPHTTSR